jgi:antirestriction protein ArdC
VLSGILPKITVSGYVAEITAAMLCHSCGVDSQSSVKNRAAYIQGWSRYITENRSGTAQHCWTGKRWLAGTAEDRSHMFSSERKKTRNHPGCAL